MSAAVRAISGVRFNCGRLLLWSYGLGGYLGRGGGIGRNGAGAGAGDFGSCFSVIFGRLSGGFISEGKTGRWVLSPPNFDIFIFPNFLNSSVLKLFGNSCGNLYNILLC